MITINNLNKSFKDNVVLKDINLQFEIGKMYAILGRNGVGKTTLLKIISRRFIKSSGEINYGELLKKDVLDINAFYFSTDNVTYFNSSFLLTVKKFLVNFKKENEKFNLDYALELANKFNLDLKKRAMGLTPSQKNILGVITTLASNKTILIFDEPIQHLDLEFRNLFYQELINLYSSEKHIILISTHIINEIQNIATNVVIIKDTEVVINEEVEKLKEKNNNESLEDIFMKVVGE